jgi:hypothetical protein
MFRFVGGLVLPLTLAVLLTAAAGRSAAQWGCAAPPAVYYPPSVAYYEPAVSYYTPPAVSYYAPPAVSYYAPPAVSYYAPPVVSYYSAPVVSYYAPAATVTTRYGLFGRPRASVVRYYP